MDPSQGCAGTAWMVITVLWVYPPLQHPGGPRRTQQVAHHQPLKVIILTPWRRHMIQIGAFLKKFFQLTGCYVCPSIPVNLGLLGQRLGHVYLFLCKLLPLSACLLESQVTFLQTEEGRLSAHTAKVYCLSLLVSWPFQSGVALLRLKNNLVINLAF